MKFRQKIVIETMNMPIMGEFTYNIKLLTSPDDGRSWWYCGIGKYAKDEHDVAQKAEQLKEEYEAEYIEEGEM